ncbi:hypothetical protein [Aneurinibacillus soli]|nr:hypothetical protein [Aneurinibacillus soli]
MNCMEVEHVPVYRCSGCDHNELMDQVKDELKRLLIHLQPEKGTVSFADYSSFTRMLLSKCNQEAELGVDDWLDMYLLVLSLNDVEWLNEIKIKLQRYSASLVVKPSYIQNTSG